MNDSIDSGSANTESPADGDETTVGETAATPAPAIGRASATEREAITSDQFHFWLKPGVLVNPFDIVEAKHFDDSLTFGLVTGLEHRTDAGSHLANFFSNNFGEITDDEPNTLRQGTTIAKAAVMSNSAGIYMPVQNESRVAFASEEGIQQALGISDMPEERRIAAGIITLSSGTESIAYLDRDFLVGPEGAHLNISGISGLATKTSYAMFVLQSLLQQDKRRAALRKRDPEIAAIILNVKHGDLLTVNLDADMSDEDAEEWRRLGLDPIAFETVRYLLPPDRNYHANHRPNSAIKPLSFDTYAYTVRETADKLELLFSSTPDAHDTLGSLLGEIHQGITGNEKMWADVHTWEDLLWKKPLFDPVEKKALKVGDVQAVSVGRFRRLLRRMVQTRQSGLFVGNRPRDLVRLDEEIAKIRPGQVVVVDIAQLQDWEQTLVFGDILKTVYEMYAENDDDPEYALPKKTVIFVDELNKYAPSGSKGSAIVEQILEVAERGRSIGVILFSAQQFLSNVHSRVPGNAATQVLGRSGSAELSSPEYRFLDSDVKGNVTRLTKGELLLSHAVYRQPVKIRFPMPSYKQTR